MRGITLPDGGDFHLSEFQIRIGPDGATELVGPTVKVRSDLWAYWLADAIDGAVDAAVHSALIPEVLASGDETELGRLLVHELRASMRAVTASAFAVDAFYAGVKARAG